MLLQYDLSLGMDLPSCPLAVQWSTCLELPVCFFDVDASAPPSHAVVSTMKLPFLS